MAHLNSTKAPSVYTVEVQGQPQGKRRSAWERVTGKVPWRPGGKDLANTEGSTPARSPPPTSGSVVVSFLSLVTSFRFIVNRKLSRLLKEMVTQALYLTRISAMAAHKTQVRKTRQCPAGQLLSRVVLLGQRGRIRSLQIKIPAMFEFKRAAKVEMEVRIPAMYPETRGLCQHLKSCLRR
jgi:hypothetical protein